MSFFSVLAYATVFLGNGVRLHYELEFRTIYLTIPLFVSLLLRIIWDFCLNAETRDEAGSLILFYNYVVTVAVTVLITNTHLKIDRRIGWKWSSIFWPIWVLVALFLGTFVVTISLLWTSLTKACAGKDQKCNRLISHIFVCLNFGLIGFGLIIFNGILPEYLESPTPKITGLKRAYLSYGIMSIVLIGLLCACYEDLAGMITSVADDREGQQSVSLRTNTERGNLRNPGHNRAGERLETEMSQEPVVKQNKTWYSQSRFPRYVMQVSSAIFEKATPQQIFLMILDEERNKKLKSVPKKPEEKIKSGFDPNSKTGIIGSAARKLEIDPIEAKRNHRRMNTNMIMSKDSPLKMHIKAKSLTNSNALKLVETDEISENSASPTKQVCE